MAQERRSELTRIATHNQPLNQRLMMRYQMDGLSKEETKGYLEHHMRLAGANYPIFSDSAIEAISLVSRGWPRLTIILPPPA
jgi:general secretion pathway protein A